MRTKRALSSRGSAVCDDDGGRVEQCFAPTGVAESAGASRGHGGQSIQMLGGPTTPITLGFDEWPSIATSTPERADDDLVFVESVVKVAGDPAKVDTSKTSNIRVDVRSAGAREDCHNLEGLFELGREDFAVGSILKPPVLLASDVFLRGGRESDVAWRHRERSSLRMSSASTRRPAAISTLESRKALWRAARSVSSSQSPGSSGRSSNSVPSGRFVGSSTTRRPAVTRALMVMAESVAPGWPPIKALEPSRLLSVVTCRRGARLSAGR